MHKILDVKNKSQAVREILNVKNRSHTVREIQHNKQITEHTVREITHVTNRTQNKQCARYLHETNTSKSTITYCFISNCAKI